MAVLKLAELGKLSVDDDVKKYFPEFPYDNVTIKLLLSHRSGLPNYIYFMEQIRLGIKNNIAPTKICLIIMIKFKPPMQARPELILLIAIPIMHCLGLIIEKASGQTYADFLQAIFFYAICT